MFLAGCGQFSIPHEPVMDQNIDGLEGEGFTHVGAARIHAMQEMKRAEGICHGKQNICGLQAGVSAAFLLDPQEAYYDVKNPPSYIAYGDGKTDYDKLGQSYPIMRPVRLKKFDLGLLSDTLSSFWTKNLRHHKTEALGFDSVGELSKRVKNEIKAGRPVLLQVRISAPDFPLFLPDDHLGPRGFHNAHWVVVLGFSDKEWLIRDNGGLQGTVDYSKHKSVNHEIVKLIRITNESFEKIANLSDLADDVKSYLTEPNLPIFLDNWDNGDGNEQLKRDFRSMKAFNAIIFSRK
jgi:hypothetical protein